MRAATDRKRLRRRERLGPRICHNPGCKNEIPAERDTRSKDCSNECRTARLDKTRAKRDARAQREADAGIAPDPRRGSRNADAKDPEAVRRGAIRAEVGLSLWLRERAIVEAWQQSRSGAEPAAAGTAAG